MLACAKQGFDLKESLKAAQGGRRAEEQSEERRVVGSPCGWGGAGACAHHPAAGRRECFPRPLAREKGYYHRKALKALALKRHRLGWRNQIGPS